MCVLYLLGAEAHAILPLGLRLGRPCTSSVLGDGNDDSAEVLVDSKVVVVHWV